MRLAGTFVLVLLLGGCEIPQEQKQRDVCTAICDCITSGPSAVEECIDEDCLPELPTVSDPCLECVYTYSQSCNELFDVCESLCDPGTPLLGGM